MKCFWNGECQLLSMLSQNERHFGRTMISSFNLQLRRCFLFRTLFTILLFICIHSLTIANRLLYSVIVFSECSLALVLLICPLEDTLPNEWFQVPRTPDIIIWNVRGELKGLRKRHNKRIY